MSTTVTRPAPRSEQTAPARARLVERLFAPVDIASLVAFRIAFGGLMAVEAYRYLTSGWIRQYWIDPGFYFTFQGFDWVQAVAGRRHVPALRRPRRARPVLMAGFAYRVSAALFFAGFTYVFLLDKANYLNHFYLIALISFVLILVPAHRSFSVDARLARSCARAPSPRGRCGSCASRSASPTSTPGSPSSTATGCTASRCAGGCSTPWTSR